MSRLLDPKKDGAYPFRYTNSASTSVKETIERAKRRIEEQKEQERRNLEERLRKTIALKARKA